MGPFSRTYSDPHQKNGPHPAMSMMPGSSRPKPRNGLPRWVTKPSSGWVVRAT